MAEPTPPEEQPRPGNPDLGGTMRSPIPAEPNTNKPPTITGRVPAHAVTRHEPIPEFELPPMRISQEKFGEYFLMDQASLAARLVELQAQQNTGEIQVLTDALGLRQLADGAHNVRQKTSNNPEEIRYIISLLEETPGVPQQTYRSQHTNLTNYLTKIIALEAAEAKRIADLPKARAGLPQRSTQRSTQAPAIPTTVDHGDIVEDFIKGREEPKGEE